MKDQKECLRTKVCFDHSFSIRKGNSDKKILELCENRTDLVYEREYNLNMKPLEIDLLVIKKDKNL